MFAEAQSKQFTLKDDGQIFFQPDSTNPLPGDALAIIRKGDTLLSPVAELITDRDLKGEDAGVVLTRVNEWLNAHIKTVLEPLFALTGDETLAEPVKNIAGKIFENTGIVARSDVDADIANLDADMRKVLRAKKVKLGPILVFIPDLNKPAAVRLRALLWALFHDATLPASIPRDGAMSAVIDVTTANPNFYRAIGYPVYGVRAVRIDMLDRVISAIYDSAKDGKFQAQHKMAEWMGCPIADLYSVLEVMGHKRIPKPEVTEEVAVKEVISEPVTEPVAEVITETTTEIVAEPAKPAQQKKPELDWFLLRRGKAHAERIERSERKPRPNFTREDKPTAPKERYEAKKPFVKKDKQAEGDTPRKPFNKDKKHGDKNNHKRDEKPRNDSRVYTAAASATDNPFAILQGLKLK